MKVALSLFSTEYRYTFFWKKYRENEKPFIKWIRSGLLVVFIIYQYIYIYKKVAYAICQQITYKNGQLKALAPLVSTCMTLAK